MWKIYNETIQIQSNPFYCLAKGWVEWTGYDAHIVQAISPHHILQKEKEENLAVVSCKLVNYWDLSSRVSSIGSCLVEGANAIMQYYPSKQ